MRRAARVDANQAAVRAALEKVGAKVKYIKEPLDLLVGFRKRNVLMEVKNRDGRDELTKAQVEFLATWPGEAYVVHTPQDALTALLGKDVMA